MCFLRRVMLIAVLAGLTVAATRVPAENVEMTPYKIILNAQGSFEDVQAIVALSLAPASQVIDFDISLSLNGVVVAQAISCYYCVIDQNLLIGFDRTALQADAYVQSLAGQDVIADVEGTVTAVASDGSMVIRSFSGSDPVEIADPGKKGR